jgi:hypothetical protein
MWPSEPKYVGQGWRRQAKADRAARLATELVVDRWNRRMAVEPGRSGDQCGADGGRRQHVAARCCALHNAKRSPPPRVRLNMRRA